MSYKVLWVADEDNRRDYRDRQLYANEKGADCYIELHFNAKKYDRPGTDDNPASVLVASNASHTSKSMAASLALKVSKEWGWPSRGMDMIGSGRRGYYNLVYTKMPAILTELLFLSDLHQANVALSDKGQQHLARLVVQTIKEHFPNGALVALSVGHLFKLTSPNDKGAPVHPDAKNSENFAEGDLALWLGKLVQLYLERENEGEESAEPLDSLDCYSAPGLSISDNGKIVRLHGEWSMVAVGNQMNLIRIDG